MFYLIVGFIAFFLLYVVFTSARSGNCDFLTANRSASFWTVASGLFTLVGGGEIATLVSLGYLYGWSAMALFLGYALAFVFLGFVAARIKFKEEITGAISLPDFIYNRFGRSASLLTFAVSLLAFFALLTLQFVVGASILAQLTGAPYAILTILMAATIVSYLSVGGFSAVLRTDVLQGCAMLLLGAIALALTLNFDGLQAPQGVPMPWFLFLGLTMTGFFVASASADVWQRAYSARSSRAAFIGFLSGAAVLLFLGFLFTAIGVSIHAAGIEVADSNAAFVEIFNTKLGAFGATIATLLVTTAILSTADTETFLLAALIFRERLRTKVSAESSSGPRFVRLCMLGIAALSTVAALLFTDAVNIYTWLLLLILCISPAVVASLFFRLSSLAYIASASISLCVFIILAVIGRLNFDNAFLITGVGAMALVLFSFFPKRSL